MHSLTIQFVSNDIRAQCERSELDQRSCTFSSACGPFAKDAIRKVTAKASNNVCRKYWDRCPTKHTAHGSLTPRDTHPTQAYRTRWALPQGLCVRLGFFWGRLGGLVVGDFFFPRSRIAPKGPPRNLSGPACHSNSNAICRTSPRPPS